ncbi:hypothetical protein CNY89_20220 [Amaricoccus sp. HAR-UPW-R2A-40]|nr:hypothetical protein CNY89_20220 [Amaricoccus sp. HAR-UPW-R2A-40]
MCGKVRLVYIDPPFATQTVFHSRKLAHAYEDVFECYEYLEFMRERLIFLHKIMADDGSIYVHLDAKMVFHVKIIMDEIFGLKNFRNCITRKKSNPKNYTRKQIRKCLGLHFVLYKIRSIRVEPPSRTLDRRARARISVCRCCIGTALYEGSRFMPPAFATAKPESLGAE